MMMMITTANVPENRFRPEICSRIFMYPTPPHGSWRGLALAPSTSIAGQLAHYGGLAWRVRLRDY